MITQAQTTTTTSLGVGFYKHETLRKATENYLVCMNECPLPHSLEKVVPILVLQFENYPLFCSKTLTFQPK